MRYLFCDYLQKIVGTVTLPLTLSPLPLPLPPTPTPTLTLTLNIICDFAWVLVQK